MTKVRFTEEFLIYLSFSHIYITNINICFMNCFSLYQIFSKVVEIESNKFFKYTCMLITEVEETLVFLFNLYSRLY